MIAQVGRNAWKRERADRVAFLIDGDAYYRAVASSLRKARRCVRLLGWDLDDRAALGPPGAPTLRELLEEAVRRVPELEVKLLTWDYSMVFAMERPLFASLRWLFRSRIDCRYDRAGVVGAAHHQKVVVVDDVVAFSGGLDITSHRWDTPEHRPDDPRRLAQGQPYPPFHDVQMVVSGPAATALAELSCDRWRACAGEDDPCVQPCGDPWPEGLYPDARDVEVAIALTTPATESRAPVHDVEKLFVDSIRAARHSIYIENQYLTNPTVGTELARRLEEPDGPDVVILCPRGGDGWLETRTIGILVVQWIEQLRRADRHGRLRIGYPRVGDTPVFIHSKVFIVDDAFARVGSANLTNRSMRVDTECDLVLEAEKGRDDVRRAIRAFRGRLLAEHLGATAEQVEAALVEADSLCGAFDALVRATSADGETRRTVEPLKTPATDSPSELLQLAADPAEPVEPEAIAERVLLDEPATDRRSARRKLVAMLAAPAAMALVWLLVPGLDEELLAFGQAGASSLGPLGGSLMVVVLFAVLTPLMMPVNLLILATGFLFAPLTGVATAFAGVLAGAAVGYGAGKVLGEQNVRRLGGGRVDRASRWLRRRGVFALAAARLLPVAPFGIVNIAAGAAGIPFGRFMFSTAMGAAPGILLLAGVLPATLDWARRWSSDRIVALAVVGVGATLLVWILARRRRMSGRTTGLSRPSPHEVTS